MKEMTFKEWLDKNIDKVCDDCPNLVKWRESRGEFWGAPCYEDMSECVYWEDITCPRYETYLEEELDV